MGEVAQQQRQFLAAHLREQAPPYIVSGIGPISAVDAAWLR
jgi:hypothetical protein